MYVPSTLFIVYGVYGMRSSQKKKERPVRHHQFSGTRKIASRSVENDNPRRELRRRCNISHSTRTQKSMVAIADSSEHFVRHVCVYGDNQCWCVAHRTAVKARVRVRSHYEQTVFVVRRAFIAKPS